MYITSMPIITEASSILRDVTYVLSRGALEEFRHSLDRPHMEDMVRESLQSKLWFVLAKVNSIISQPHHALVDTGCSRTCIREDAWLRSDRTGDENFIRYQGVITGAAGDTIATVEGTAIITLFLMDVDGRVVELRTRAMIVRNLQGPLYLGQDLFENKNVYSHLDSGGIQLKNEQGGLHYVPFKQPEEDSSESAQAPPQLTHIRTLRCNIPQSTPETLDEKIREDNSAIVNEIAIPEEFDILKRPRTLTDDQLLSKFELTHLDDDSRGKVESLILKFAPIWSEHPFDLGLHKYVQHQIILTAPLPPCPKQRFWPSTKREAAEELIANLEKYKIVEKCIADWATNVVLIKKQPDPANQALEQPLLDSLLDKQTIPTPENAKYRLCLDLRPTNSVTKPDVATLGNMDAMFMHLSGKPARSSFDFTSGFFQIALTKESKGTTFFVHRKSGSGIMKFNRSIQGSKNASSVFTRAMEVTFSGLEDKVNYWIDDLIAHSEDVDSHLKDLELVFERVKMSNIKLSPSKAKFLCGKIKYLGMVIEGDEFCIADKKLQAIDDLSPPKNQDQLRSQLALFQYYKKFVPFFSEVILPLQRMMKKGVTFEWTKECTSAYVLLKSLFKEKISLHIPNPKHPYVVHTDASSFASAAVLQQRVEGELVPVAFHSEAFTGAQLNYSILDKELYALVDAIKRFEYYLSGTTFELFTDSKALLYLRKAKEANPKLLRYSLILQGFDFSITHVSSSENKVADILSRTTNEEGQIVARQLHKAKKTILEKIHSDTEKVVIPEGRTLTAGQVVQLLSEPYKEKEERGNEPGAAASCETPKVMIRALYADLNNEATDNTWAATSFQSGGMDLADFLKMQAEDDFCQEIENALRHEGMRDIYGHVGGILVRLPHKREQARDEDKKLTPKLPRPVVPEKMVNLLIERIHSGPTGAHVGASRVFTTLSRKYHFKEMQAKIRNKIASCLPCQLNMYTTRGNHELQITTHDSVPRRSWAVDLSTDYPKVNGWSHILVLVDLASNYVLLKPLKNKTSKELTMAFKELMACFGTPSIVRHDQEKGLVGGEFKDMCEALCIRQITGLPNKPQTNGKVEAQVKNVKYALKSLTTAESTKGRWPQELWRVQIALNTCVSRATMETPELIMFGHEGSNNCYDLIERVTNTGEMHHEAARISINDRADYVSLEYHENMRKRLEVRNKRRRSNDFRVNDLVWRQIMQPTVPGTRHALDCRYSGPYRILELGEASAVIEGEFEMSTGPTRVHIDQLKPVNAETDSLGQEWDAHIRHRLGESARTTRSETQAEEAEENLHRESRQVVRPDKSFMGMTEQIRDEILPEADDPMGEISTVPPGGIVFHGTPMETPTSEAVRRKAAVMLPSESCQTSLADVGLTDEITNEEHCEHESGAAHGDGQLDSEAQHIVLKRASTCDREEVMPSVPADTEETSDPTELGRLDNEPGNSRNPAVKRSHSEQSVCVKRFRKESEDDLSDESL